MTKEENLARRLEFIREDISRVITFIYDNKLNVDFRKPTDFCDEAWTLIWNIVIASDLECNESDTWRKGKG